MAGLVPAIHVFTLRQPKQDVDRRDEPGDDDVSPYFSKKKKQYER